MHVINKIIKYYFKFLRFELEKMLDKIFGFKYFLTLFLTLLKTYGYSRGH